MRYTISLVSIMVVYGYGDNQLVQKLEVVVNSETNVIGKFAKERHLKLHRWPPSITEGEFDLGLVVSFGRLLPENIIDKFPLGLLNVHGSLLPKYRGAAPIIYALANGDKETGVTIMKLQPKQFDTGEIISQRKFDISPTLTMPELHERLGKLGAELLVETIKNLPDSVKNAKPQPNEGVTYAPKVSPDFGQINWKTMTASDIWNRYRALKGMYPLTTNSHSGILKILDLSLSKVENLSSGPGFVQYDRDSKSLIVECASKTFICVKLLNLPGKKSMTAVEFQNGYIKKNTDCYFS